MSFNNKWTLYFSSVFSTLVNIIVPLYLVRVLTTEEVGIYRIFTFYLQYFPQLIFVSGFISGFPIWANKKDNGKVYLNQSFSIILALSILGLILYIAGSFIFSSISQISVPYFLFAMSFIFYTLSFAIEEFLVASNRLELASFNILISEMIKTITVFSSIYFFKTVEALLLGFFIAFVIKVILGIIQIKKVMPLQFLWHSFIKTEVKKYAVPVSFASFLSFFVERSDQFILSIMILPKDFALYSLGCLMLPPIFILEQTLTRVTLPKLVQNEHNRDHFIHLYKTLIKDLAFYLIPSSIGLFVFAKPLIVLLYGAKYSDAAFYLSLFSFYYLLCIFPENLIHRALSKGQAIFKASLIFAPTSILLTLILSILFGPTGAILAMLLTKLTQKIYFYFEIKKLLNLTQKEIFPTKELLIYTFWSLLLGAIFTLIKNNFINEEQWMFIGILSFIIIYLSMNTKSLKSIIGDIKK